MNEKAEWKKSKLEDVIQTLIDYRGKTPNKTSFGVPLITAKVVKGGFIQEPNEFIAENDYEGWMTRGFPKIGDVVLTVEAPLGEVAQIKMTKIALAQRIITLRGKENILDNSYLKYFFQSDIGQQRLKARETGTTVTGIKQSELKLVEIDMPDFKTQQRIASILSSLDDKIELNRQTNKTLETIAQTLFKEMCLPKGEKLSEGWEVGVLKDVLEIKYGKDHKHLDNGSIPLYGSGGIMRYVDKSLYENESILIPRKGTLSNLFYINKPFWSVDTMFYSKIKEQYHGKFLFHLLQSLNLESMNVGSAVPSLTTEILNNIEINIPPHDILKKFDDLVTPIFQKLEDNEEESNTLATLRDSLLPKLMKREISV